MKRIATLFFFCALTGITFSQTGESSGPIIALQETVLKSIKSKKGHCKDITLQIWNFSEVGHKEVRSSALL